MLSALLIVSLLVSSLPEDVTPARVHAPEATTPWSHAFTLFGEPDMPRNFRHFPYVNPDAPKGGTLKLADPSAFDSLNFYILKGVKPAGILFTTENLMTASLDEPQTYYPLIARQYRMNRPEGWIEFELDPRARWHDGEPVTAGDVLFSLKMMQEKADPVYRLTFAPLTEPTITGKGRIRFSFDPDNREAPLIAASLPILPAHYYCEGQEQSQTDVQENGSRRTASENSVSASSARERTSGYVTEASAAERDLQQGSTRTCQPFDKTTLTPPLGSGPYRVEAAEAGRRLVLKRDPDYWGKDLPVNRGQYNFDRIQYDVYRDETVSLEAFKSAAYDFRQEYVARNWATAYDVPALKEGRFTKEHIPHSIPQGMQAFFFNLRQPHLSDRRLREAIALTMDFDWMNQALFYGAYARNTSFFQNTDFAATGMPGEDELRLLAPYRSQLPEGVFGEAWMPPKSDGSGANRTNLLRAQGLLEEAGYDLDEEGRRIDPNTGKPLEVEFLMSQQTMVRPVMAMRKGLQRLGILTRVRMVDAAQYQRQVDTRDFDIISGWVNQGVFFPGVEQMNLWHSGQAGIEGSNNITGLAMPVVDSLLERITAAHTLEELQPAARALDRVLLSEQIVIPHWHSNSFRVAYWNHLAQPERAPKYGLALHTWWAKPEAK